MIDLLVLNIMEVLLMNDNLLIENAILAFLHNYPDHKWTEDYRVLLSKVQDLNNEQPKDAEVRTSGTQAKRQRKKETSSNTSSKEENKTT